MSEKCNSCDQMKKENTATRKALMETNKMYVEVINENLALRKQLEEIETAVKEMKKSTIVEEEALKEIQRLRWVMSKRIDGEQTLLDSYDELGPERIDEHIGDW